MRSVDIILKKKEGKKLTYEEFAFIINGYLNKSIPDYQVSALLMAIIFNPLDEEEAYYLTKVMVESGEVIDLSSINGICCDKHSTGGVGDKTTLIIAPILASFGLYLAKMSGRGLGHTGGTLDKLESIPSFNISLGKYEFLKQVNEIGLCVVGQTANIAPADKLLYALRDVTGTVDSMGLIASSIMSKKIASGANTILLDCKVGDGAFMKNINDASKLASLMVKIGKQFNRNVVCILTDMDSPLGYSIGNSLEVIEAIETLKGNGPSDLKTICYEICSLMLITAKVVSTKEEALLKIDEVIKNGSALNKLSEMIKYQNGNPEVINDYSLFKQAKKVIEVKARITGYIKKIKTSQIGVSAMLLGAGRETKDSIINPSVGLKLFVKTGDYIKENDVIGLIYTDGEYEKSMELIYEAIEVSENKVKHNDLILGIIHE